MADQIVDAMTAKALQDDALRTHGSFAWAVSYDDPAYPGRYVARLVAARPLSYCLVGNSLAEVQE